MRRSGFVQRFGCAAMATLVSAALLAPAGTATGATTKGDGTGPPPPGLGIGSARALSQEWCDAATRRTNFVDVGSGPWCVNPWPAGKDNGGATATGVTGTEVKVVVYVANEQMLAQGSGAATNGRPVNQATREPATPEASIRDFEAIYAYATEQFHTYELWGRTPVFEIVEASGADETAQRADAVEVLEREPFMVMDGSDFTLGADVFSTAVASAKTLVWSASTNEENATAQAPYRWSGGQDTSAGPYVIGSFVAQSLSGRKAKFAGDDAMTSKPRAFGVVYPQSGVDLDAFEQSLSENGAEDRPLALEYDETDPALLDQQAPTLVTRLKGEGVTSVVLFADGRMMASLMKAATAQDYRPEWILTGFAFHDFDGFGRGADQSQMAHAFGAGILPPSYDGTPAPGPAAVFPWYWGTSQGNTSSTLGLVVQNAYVTMHYAGPKLTAANVQKGLFAAPATGGAADGTTYFQSGFGRTVGVPYNEHAAIGTDRNLAWWNAELTGPSNAAATLVGKGKLMYLDGGKRFRYAGFPTKQPKFFDESASVGSVPVSSAYVGNVVPAPNPCVGCPSTGAAS